MLDIAEELVQWAAEGRDFAVATVVAVSGSAPRGPGAALAVDGAGRAAGSVSGGCIEAAVHDLCVRALEDGTVLRERFGPSDDDAFAAGLTCGGTIEVVAAPFPAAAPGRDVLVRALTAAARGEAAALARAVRGPAGLLHGALLVRPDGTYDGGLGGRPALDRTAAAEAHALLRAGRTGTVDLSPDGTLCPGGLTLLVESVPEPPRLIIFGAVDFTAALVRIGAFLGYHVTVCDARPVFATAARFPGADEVVADWPHRYLRGTPTDERTVLCVLTHDAKFDVPLLRVALRLPVAFVGAMGSRRTHEDRVRRLREAGVGDGELARLRAPVGLDLGGRTPEETALSIAAEIVAARHGGTGLPLTGTRTAIHRTPAEHPAGQR
ncbi:XdhC family protein [Streptomyces caatingaensis]|uniref:XshC-Cox1-family protein n=1 Tax=Streptomyces caatingaensis TaxID=1678637 RepID=A0A0K9XAZ6_9ACTN|nr:XdhC/CoxI family protein [Streptomyces caatingaensis]KNB50590.1 XshC-Cox1-family protein [Streptomyces caatingaensis]